VTRIIVLDDEQVVRDLMVEILERAGYDVEAVEFSRELIDLVEAGGVDLVVTDLVMPEVSGLDVLEQLKLRSPELPVIVVTGASTEHNVTRAVELGAAAVLMKPFKHGELRNAVARALDD
jgi:DNA-binding NtrC family response regulator